MFRPLRIAHQDGSMLTQQLYRELWSPNDGFPTPRGKAGNGRHINRLSRL